MIEKNKFWKLYTIPLVLLALIFLNDIKYFSVWEYILLSFHLISVLGYISFLWNKTIMPPVAWVLFLIFYILYILLYYYFGYSSEYSKKFSNTPVSPVLDIIEFIVIYPILEAIFHIISISKKKQIIKSWHFINN